MTCQACGAQTADDSRFCPGCGTPLGAPAPPEEARKNVTMLFIDVVGSTALAEQLDPEALRQVMDRYFDACLAAVTAHGGAVEKFIGDAVLAVFGATVAHEDDAVRAVRAAAQSLAGLQDISVEIEATHGVSLQARCGVCSGEVVVITAAGRDFRVVGDAVNTAARLQTAAGPGEILAGATTAALVRGQIGLEQIPQLRLKGKAQAVPAWRVTDPAGDDAGEARQAAPLIGRDDELTELRQCFRRVLRRGQACLATVVGTPGIGKSRLVREFLSGLDGDSVTILAGRCSSYGRGITYRPLAQMLAAGDGGWAELAGLLAADEPGRRAVRSLATIMRPERDPRLPGAGEGTVGIEEISWAVRHLLEALGQARPVIVVWEDLHWAEQTLLDLISDVTTWLADVPVLLLCVARTELLELRPTWGGGQRSAVTLELEPLSFEQSAELAAELVLHGEVHAQAEPEQQRLAVQVARECDGNPLFAELMLDVFAETVPGPRIPPTINALLGARLDQLPAAERWLLEMAATIGREFGHAPLQAIAQADEAAGLAGPDAAGPESLRDLAARLTRRRLIQRTGPGQFRFTQTVLHDTAYSLTPKGRRERWHLFLAQWQAGRLAQAGGAGADDALVFACHAESAMLLGRELRPGASGGVPLASEAADVLIGEGSSALARKDLPAAAALLERGRAILPPGDPRHIALALHISDSWIGLWEPERALSALAALRDALPGDRGALVTCAVQEAIVRLRLGLAPAHAIATGLGAVSADLAELAGDDVSWCRYHQLRAYLELAGEHTSAACRSLEQALDRARAQGSVYEEERLLCAICEVSQWTPEPVATGLAACRELASRFAANRALLVPVLVVQSYLTALAGHLADARLAVAAALEHASALHIDRADAAVLEARGLVEILAGEPARAEASYRQAALALRGTGEAADWPVLQASIGRALLEQDRVDEAAAALDALPGGPSDLTVRAQIVTAALRARIASARSRHDEAVALAATARRLTAGTDDPFLAGLTMFDAAVVLAAAGQPGPAAQAAASALASLDAKGAALPASRVRDWLALLPPRAG